MESELPDGTQQQLGRIEAGQKAINEKLDLLRGDFSEHKAEDQRSFSSLRVTMGHRFEENERTRNAHLTAQDIKLDALKQDNDRARGAGWVIIGLVTFLGTAVIAALIALMRFIKFH